MPRRGRVFIDGLAYHILNRGNRRAPIFSEPADYERFLATLAQALIRFPVCLIAYALMPNHFHFVVWPTRAYEISGFMKAFMNAHIRRHHRYKALIGTGHLYQGRFKSFPIQTDHHLLTAIRYVEANPLRAQLVTRAEEWPWTSLVRRHSAEGQILITDSHVRRPSNWLEIVNQPMSSETRDALRHSAQRQVGFGGADWLRFIETKTGDTQK
jgi:putative transposase